MPNTIEIWTNVNGQESHVGVARFSFRKTVTTTFSYDTDYISLDGSYELDETLKLGQGGGVCNSLPPSFRDCAPDRWGQKLIEKEYREKRDEATPRALTDVDYLLGISDITRQGSLRFRSNGKWLGSNATIPPIIDIYELMQASYKVANDIESYSELKTLLDAGTSALGGARPKASVRDGDKLMIAKFSHPQDKYDVIGLEKTMIDLEKFCGIDVPSCKLVRFGNSAALITERFDRHDGKYNGRRIPYKSGMTLLGLQDGEHSTYLDLLMKMQQDFGNCDINQMLRRICFSYVFNNTDDHLKNHGFLLHNNKWRLSPCFDVNPTLFTKERTTLITGSNKPEHEQFLELCELFDVSRTETKTIIEDINYATKKFKTQSAKNEVPSREISTVIDMITQRIACLQEAIR